MLKFFVYLGIFLLVIGLMLVAVYLEDKDKKNESQTPADQVPPTRGEHGGN